MAHPEKREVSLQVGSETYTMVLDMTAYADMEGQFLTPGGEPKWTFFEILQKAGRGFSVYIRAVIWAALRRHHPTITLDQAGDIVMAVGLANMGESMQALQKTAEPDPVDVKELPTADPPTAQPTPKGRGGAARGSTRDRSG